MYLYESLSFQYNTTSSSSTKVTSSCDDSPSTTVFSSDSASTWVKIQHLHSHFTALMLRVNDSNDDCNGAEETAEHPVLMTRLSGRCGPTFIIKAILDACGAFWRGSGHDASHQLGMRERESRTSLRIHQLILSSTNHVKASSPVQSQKLAFVHCHCGLVLRK